MKAAMSPKTVKSYICIVYTKMEISHSTFLLCACPLVLGQLEMALIYDEGSKASFQEIHALHKPHLKDIIIIWLL